MSSTVEASLPADRLWQHLLPLQAEACRRCAVSTNDESTLGWERWGGAGSTEEHERLMLIERAYDTFTVAHLERTGVAKGWRCLEVGAGAGSIAVWLAQRA